MQRAKPAEGQAIESHNDDQRTPRLVYGLVYKGLGALARVQPKLRLSWKSKEKQRADERTRTADLISSYVAENQANPTLPWS